jgi:flagellar motor switch protein FliG
MSMTVPFSKVQKAAAILVALGKPRASHLLKYFKDEEKRALITAAKSLTAIEQNDLDKLVKEFEAEFTRGAGLIDSSDIMDGILTEALTAEELESLSNPVPAVAVQPASPSAWDMLEGADPAKIVALLGAENLQAGAYMLSKLSSEKSALVIAGLDRTARSAILTRMISMGAALPAVVEVLERRLAGIFGVPEKGDSKAGQIHVANILNQLDKAATEEVMSDLSTSIESARVSAVRSMLFRFEDIVRLEDSARASVFDQVPANILTLALRDASPEILETALSSIGQRTRRMIENDLKTQAGSKPRDILDAQRKIVSMILRLSAEGRIALPSADLAA